MGWTVRGSNPGGARLSAVQTGPGAQPSACTMSTESFCGRKRPGRGADPSPPSSAEVYKQSRAITLLSLRAFVAYKKKGQTYIYIYIHSCLSSITRFQNKQRIIKLHKSRKLINFKITTFPSAHKYRYFVHVKANSTAITNPLYQPLTAAQFSPEDISLDKNVHLFTLLLRNITAYCHTVYSSRLRRGFT